MTRIAPIVVIVLAVALAAGASTANAAPSPQAQIAKLTSQVTALQKSVKKLQSDLKKEQAALDSVAGFFSVVDACQSAVIADALQGTWGIVDQLLAAGGKPVAWGPQAAVNDYGACALFKTTPIVHGITTPATTANLSALITIIHG
jgi:outer membrane murein-binding lipoprotein Lpp